MDQKKFNYLWFFYIIFSWFFYLIIFLFNLTHYFIIIIVLLGLLLYTQKLKLDGINTINEINFKIIFYYIFWYFYYVALTGIIFGLVYWQYKNGFLKEYYDAYISDEQFLRHTKRWILILPGSFIAQYISTNGGFHLISTFHNYLGEFNKNINLLSIVFIFTSLFWWFISDFIFISIFITTITFATLPDFIKKKIIKISLFLNKINYRNYLKIKKNNENINKNIINNKKIFEKNMTNLKKNNYYGWLVSSIINLILSIAPVTLVYIILYCIFCGLIPDYFITKFVINKYAYLIHLIIKIT